MHVLHTECADHALANGNGFALAFCCARATTHCLSREKAMSTGRLPHVFRTGVLLAALVALPAVSFAGSWPQQTVRILTGPLAAGSSIDATARVLAEEL